MTIAPLIDWHAYNVSAAGRPARRQVSRVIAAAGGDGPGRTVLEIGAGGGADALEFARRGWTVYAYDTDDTLASRLIENTRMTGTVHFRHGDVADIETFPSADAVFAAYTLPMLGQELPLVWERLRTAVKPGGIFAVDLFGEFDSWAEQDGVATLSAEQIDAMFEGLQIIRREIRDEDGRSFDGEKKHWHVHSVMARAPR